MHVSVMLHFFLKRTVVYWYTKQHDMFIENIYIMYHRNNDMFIGNIYIMYHRTGCAIRRRLPFIHLHVYEIII